VHRLLPPELRDHVLLIADRAYGIARMLELGASLDWAWLVRVQWQTRVLRREGTICAIRDLVPRPGTLWLGHDDPPATRDGQPASADDPEDFAGAAPTAGAADSPVAVFRVTGWRASQVVAAWPVGEAEPWLLVTSLPGTRARLRDDAQRWAIERLFLSWKTHGWGLDTCGLRDPVRLGHLLTGLVVATLWRLAAALPVALQHLADLATRASRRHRPAGVPPACWQLPLPLWAGPPAAPATAPPLPAGAARPWAARFSLFTLGSRAFRHTPCRTATPALCWTFPDWEAPIWSLQAHQVYAGPT
jgi:DDE family transposase